MKWYVCQLVVRATVVTAQRIRAQPVAGPFVFEFSVPFTPGRRLEVAQTAERNGVAVTLQQVILTPSEARAVLCIALPAGDEIDWLPIATLQGAGREVVGASSKLGETCHRYSFFAYQAPIQVKPQEEWTLTVKELVGFLAQPGEGIRLAGPWVFHFRVP